jgi:hypothetical protein
MEFTTDPSAAQSKLLGRAGGCVPSRTPSWPVEKPEGSDPLIWPVTTRVGVCPGTKTARMNTSETVFIIWITDWTPPIGLEFPEASTREHFLRKYMYRSGTRIYPSA